VSILSGVAAELPADIVVEELELIDDETSEVVAGGS